MPKVDRHVAELMFGTMNKVDVSDVAISDEPVTSVQSFSLNKLRVCDESTIGELFGIKNKVEMSGDVVSEDVLSKVQLSALEIGRFFDSVP